MLLTLFKALYNIFTFILSNPHWEARRNGHYFHITDGETEIKKKRGHSQGYNGIVRIPPRLWHFLPDQKKRCTQRRQGDQVLLCLGQSGMGRGAGGSSLLAGKARSRGKYRDHPGSAFALQGFKLAAPAPKFLCF
jgi:hypothetical protein